MTVIHQRQLGPLRKPIEKIGVSRDQGKKCRCLRFILIEIVSRFLVIIEGTSFEVLSLGLFCLFIGQFSRMAPFPFLFIRLDLSVCFCNGAAFDDEGRREENPVDRILAVRAGRPRRVCDPLNHLKP